MIKPFILLATGIIVGVIIWAHGIFLPNISIEEYLLVAILGRTIYYDLVLDTMDWDEEDLEEEEDEDEGH